MIAAARAPADRIKAVNPHETPESRLNDVNPMTVIARTDAIEPGGVLQVMLDQRPPLALVRLADEFFVIDDLCTHGAASLSEGDIVGGEIECPYHAGRFDIRSGAVTALPCTRALRVYPVRVEHDHVYADLDAGTCVDGPA